MNIKEIARLSGVSTSTVSKVINNKAQNISDETRKRVLKIIKDYNYTPYAGVSNKAGQKSFLIGVALDASQDHEFLGSRIVELARQDGYTSILCRSGSAQEELKNLTALCGYQIDGIIWDRRRDSLDKSLDVVKNKSIPLRMMDFFKPCSPDNSCIDFRKLGYGAAKAVIDNKHSKAFCLAQSRGSLEECFFQGFQMAFLKNGLAVDGDMIWVLDEHGNEIPNRLLFDSTAAVCFSQKQAAYLYELAARKNRRIPKYLSVVSLAQSPDNWFQPELTTVLLPYKELAAHVCSRLVADMEGRRSPDTSFLTREQVSLGKSVDLPLSLRKKRVVVVGSINMDTLISLEAFPKMGETTLVGNVTVMPGGKGLNQSIAASRLGAEPYLIGKVGKDYEGSEIFDYLESNQISAEGISHTSKVGTGHAYVHVQGDGESGIVIYRGANGALTSHDISENIGAFQNASFCLLQTEIGMEIVEYAAQIAYNEGVKILLKPSAIKTIEDSLVEKVYVFLPNENEINRLCPGTASHEERADTFLKKGAKNVIITLGNKGCYWSNGTRSRYFPAAQFQAVDTTGAADAFAAALAACLIRDMPMETAIEYANFAAGFSTTKLGACSAMIDQTTLEFHMTSGRITLDATEKPHS